MKKITLLLFVLIYSITALAGTTTNYTGTMTTTGNEGTIVDNNAVVTLEDDGRGLYKMTIENFYLYVMGEQYSLGTMEYSNMMAMPDDDDENLMVVSGTKQVNFLDYMDLSDLLGGMDPGMLGSMIGSSFPISMEAKFNETTMTANFECRVVITMGGWGMTLLDEPVTKNFVGVSQNQTNPDPALYLIGSFNEWSEENMVPLTLGNDGKWTITQAMDADAEFKLKDENGNWLGGVSEGNFIVTQEQVTDSLPLTLSNPGMNFQIPVAGTWTLTVDKENLNMVISGEWNEPVTDPALYLIGSFNEWNEETKVPLTLGNDGKWTITQAMDADAEFKLKDENGNWLGGVSEGNFIVTQEQVDEATPLTLSNPGMNFQIPVAGTWTLTVDKENLNMVISGEWSEPVPEPVDVYILGEVNGNTWATNLGVKMEKAPDANIYTADVYVTSEIAEDEDVYYGFFTFSTKLAEGDNDWEFIAPYITGAVSNGDFLVTEEFIGTPISLTNENGQSFKIPIGDYSLSLNLDEMKLTITKEAVDLKEGDVNGDGVVDVADVNAAINIILETKTEADYIGNADLTGDGVVDVSDVNAIINIILNS